MRFDLYSRQEYSKGHLVIHQNLTLNSFTDFSYSLGRTIFLSSFNLQHSSWIHGTDARLQRIWKIYWRIYPNLNYLKLYIMNLLRFFIHNLHKFRYSIQYTN